MEKITEVLGPETPRYVTQVKVGDKFQGVGWVHKGDEHTHPFPGKMHCYLTFGDMVSGEMSALEAEAHYFEIEITVIAKHTKPPI